MNFDTDAMSIQSATGIPMSTFRASGESISNHPPREQISEEGEAKFLILNHKRSVYVKDEEELKILSEYIGIDCAVYFKSYLNTGFITPIIVYCNHRLSLAGNVLGDMEDILSKVISGNKTLSFDERCRRALSLEAFLDPDGHLEELI